jgi:glycosyltransferase involved in cell wall biosynthesis
VRIAVVFEANPLAGGGFHDSLSATLLVSRVKNSDGYVFIYYTLSKGNAAAAKAAGLNTKILKFGRKERLVHKLRKNLTFNRWFQKLGILKPIDEQFNRDKIDLVYFTGPNPLCLFLEQLNYILPVWDLCHRDHPEFPEVRERFEFESRENFLRTALPKATAVIAESPFGRKSLIRRYGLDPEKVHFVWKPPSSKIISLEKSSSDFNPRLHLKIPKEAHFIFYPAQFWAHKNHRLIIEALCSLRKNHNLEIFAIFCGSDCGNLEPVLDYSMKLGVSHLIKYVGFAPDEHIPQYYKESLALVMPSCFGPTNMPPIEGFVLGTPVIVADLPGFKDQVGDAGELVNPYDHKDLTKKLLKLLTEPDYRQELIRKGKKRANLFSDFERLKTLELIFKQFENKHSLWTFD